MKLKNIFSLNKKNSKREDQKNSLVNLKRVAFNTILIGFLVTIIIELYYVFVIVDMTLFDIITSISLVCIVFLIGIAYLLEQLEKTEKGFREAEYLQSLIIKQLEGKVRDRTDEVKKLLKQKNDFVNQLGHDLKTPLMPLCNLIPILLKKENNKDNKKILEIINRNVDYISNLVNKTIELAKLNSSNTSLNFKKNNLFDIANDSIIFNKDNFNKNKFEIINNISKDIFVKSDKLRLQELFTNLFTNSIKYSFKKGVITLDTEINNDFVTVSISDNGLGLSSDQINHIFDEFYKVDKSRHDINSSGLGMTICKKIVEGHGGKIWIESPGLKKGSIVYFTLPIVNKNSNISSIDEIRFTVDNYL